MEKDNTQVNNPETFKKWLLGDPEARDEKAQIGLLTLRGFSIAELSRESRLGVVSIYSYISGRRRPTPETLRRVCDALHVPYSEGLKHIKPSKMGRPFKNDK